jgi:hypothetical protein
MHGVASFLILLSLATPPQQKREKPQQFKVLVRGDEVLSFGGPLQFDEIGVKFVEKAKYEGNDDIYDGHRFSPSPEFWAMIKRNLAEASAAGHFVVKDGRLYHDGQLINFGGLEVKWMDRAVFWLDWVVGPGLTTKSGPPGLNNLEPHELLYYNFRTREGGSIYVGGKGASAEVRILTQ